VGVPESDDAIRSRPEISSEEETAYLLQSAAMKKRLLTAKDRDCGIMFEAVVEILGI
jgi:hypothetical protein